MKYREGVLCTSEGKTLGFIIVVVFKMPLWSDYSRCMPCWRVIIIIVSRLMHFLLLSRCKERQAQVLYLIDALSSPPSSSSSTLQPSF